MGYKTLVLILIISLLSISCSAVNYSTQPNYSERDYSEFNKIGQKHRATILLLNGNEITTNFVSAENDSLIYHANKDIVSIPLSKIEKVVFKKWVTTIAFASIIGIAGVVVPIGIAHSLERNGSDLYLYVALMGLIVGLSAFVLGIIYGGETTYVFNEKVTNE